MTLKPQMMRLLISQGRTLKTQLEEVLTEIENESRLDCRCYIYTHLPEGDPSRDDICSPCQARACVKGEIVH